MEIGFDISQTGAGKAGCGFYASALIEGLLAADVGHRYTLFPSFGDSFHDPAVIKQPPHKHPKVRYGPCLCRREEAAQFWQDRGRASALLNRFDLVHANNFWCPPWLPSSPLVYTLYDMSFAEHPEWTTEANRLVCFKGVLNASFYATRYVAISQATKTAFLRHFPHVDSARVCVIYPASRFEQHDFVSAESTPPDADAELFQKGDPFFLCVSTIEPRKNHELLVRAYARFRSRSTRAIPLVLAGGGGWLMDDFAERVAACHWAADVHLLGYVSDAELAWLYRHCLANLYPSHYEGFGLPVLESMGFSAAVVSSDRLSLPEIVGDAGLLLSPDDEEAWAQAMEELAGSPSLVRDLGVAAQARASGFSWQASTDQLLALYADVFDAAAA